MTSFDGVRLGPASPASCRVRYCPWCKGRAVSPLTAAERPPAPGPETSFRIRYNSQFKPHLESLRRRSLRRGIILIPRSCASPISFKPGQDATLVLHASSLETSLSRSFNKPLACQHLSGCQEPSRRIWRCLPRTVGGSMAGCCTRWNPVPPLSCASVHPRHRKKGSMRR